MKRMSANLAAALAVAALAMPGAASVAPIPSGPRRQRPIPVWRRRSTDPLAAEREAWNEAIEKRNAARKARRSQRGSGVVVLLALIAFTLLGSLTVFASSLECKAQWAGSGLRASYGFFAGCRVQRADGTWIPTGAVRDLPIAAPATPVAESIPQ